MRIIAGVFKGRKLEKIDTDGIRPTSDRVKEALFSILGDNVINSKFLDLFSGCGSIGIEAYSRGAAEVIFVDASIKSIEILNSNIRKIGIEKYIEIVNMNYNNAICKLADRGKKFDIIFADPPYKSNIYFDILRMIDHKNILTKNGIVVIEQDSKEPESYINGYLKLIKKKIYGNSQLLFYTFNEYNKEDEDEDMRISGKF